MDISDNTKLPASLTIGRMKKTNEKRQRWFDVLLRRLPEKKLTRPELIRRIVARLGVAESTVYAWLNGRREVTPDELITIIEEAGFTVSEILQEDIHFIRDDTELAIIELLRTMPSIERSIIVKLLLGDGTFKILQQQKKHN